MNRGSTLDLGRFAGPIFAIILVVDCLFFMFLEWWMPECDMDKVQMHWEHERFVEVGCVYIQLACKCSERSAHPARRPG